MVTTRLGLSSLTAGVSTRANLISYWNANLAILDTALVTNAGASFRAGHGAGVVTSNVALGIDAMNNNTTGAYCVAVGMSALHDMTTGSRNTGVGYRAGAKITTGQYNSAFGQGALGTLTTADNNTALGRNALQYATGEQNTAMGANSGTSLTTGNNVSCIGYNAQASGATTTNEIVLGDGNIARIRCHVTTITALSDERDKANIVDLPLGLAFLRDLKPRRFSWQKRIRNEDGTLGERGEIGAADSGFVAQEIQVAAATHSAEWMELVFSMQNGEVLETTTGKLLPVAIKAIQELAATVEALTVRIAAMENPA